MRPAKLNHIYKMCTRYEKKSKRYFECHNEVQKNETKFFKLILSKEQQTRTGITMSGKRSSKTEKALLYLRINSETGHFENG